MGLATPTPEQHNCDTCIISQLKDESISLPSLQFVGEFAPHALQLAMILTAREERHRRRSMSVTD